MTRTRKGTKSPGWEPWSNRHDKAEQKADYREEDQMTILGDPSVSPNIGLIERAEKIAAQAGNSHGSDMMRELVEALKSVASENVCAHAAYSRLDKECGSRIRELHAERDRVAAENKKLWAIASAAKSVASEEGMRERLLCYVMGAKLLEELADLPERKP